MFTFRAMNTDVQVLGGEDDEAIARAVAAAFAAAERRFSRFREDSELSALNRAESPFIASPQLFGMLERARAYVELTQGIFDPAIGATLRALGYDRSFAPGALDREHTAAPPSRGQFLDVALDHGTRTVWRPGHVQIDLGGMAKGTTVDLAALHLRGSGAIDAGGDMVVRGPSPTGDSWLVDIEDPADPSQTLTTIAVSDAAVATSAGNRRRWRVGHDFAHHLIDPRTQRSSASDLAQSTVIAASAEQADIFAKTAFLLGARAGRRFLEGQPGVAAVLVHKNGRHDVVGRLDMREVAHA